MNSWKALGLNVSSHNSHILSSNLGDIHEIYEP